MLSSLSSLHASACAHTHTICNIPYFWMPVTRDHEQGYTASRMGIRIVPYHLIDSAKSYQQTDLYKSFPSASAASRLLHDATQSLLFLFINIYLNPFSLTCITVVCLSTPDAIWCENVASVVTHPRFFNGSYTRQASHGVSHNIPGTPCAT